MSDRDGTPAMFLSQSTAAAATTHTDIRAWHILTTSSYTLAQSRHRRHAHPRHSPLPP
eukprot:CAMPEP_0183359568 /NCGR_PEP_ID=MMETSP0164_2-20130417/52606_1 /TAXON_ID=221442 /ORGANISM="Coccolithus pelagicus ssp braarudi, Strain PLY182g" /LENGTH=57 /DNA_ID=CAMNT_0025533711 /DNA_START=13 /DNA_END=182 /DNA_ORIENTATION=+